MTAVSAPVSGQDQDPDQGAGVAGRASRRRAREEGDHCVAAGTVEDRTRVVQYDNGFGTPFIFQTWHGLHLAGGNFPAGAGVKFGVGFTHDLGPVRPAADPMRPNRVEVDATAAMTRGYSRGTAGLNIYQLGGAPVNVRVRGQHYEFPQEDFFGFGQNSQENDRTSYLLRSTEAGAEMEWHIRFIDIAGGVSYLTPAIGSVPPAVPVSRTVLQSGTLPGFASQPDFDGVTRRSRSTGATIRCTRTRRPLRRQSPTTAIRISNAFDFHRVAIDLQQYVPLPNRYRTIALHAAAVFTEPRAGQDVPIYFQPTLGGAQALRGFREFRFRDRNSLLLSGRYRWEAPGGRSTPRCSSTPARSPPTGETSN